MKKKPPEIRGAAIIATLLILTVLTIMVVAFMQSMRIDRLTARSYLKKGDVEIITHGAAEAAEARLISSLGTNSFFSSGYRTYTLDGKDVPVPVIYSASSLSQPFQYTYLISTPLPTSAPTFASQTSGSFPKPAQVEMNFVTAETGSGGWMGSPTASAENKTTTSLSSSRKAPWVYLLKDTSLPEQPDPTKANYNPVISRYAYWIEDNASKLAFPLVGNAENSGAFLRADEARSPTALNANEPLKDLDLGALPLLSSQPLDTSASSTTINRQIIDFFGSSWSKPLAIRDWGLINRITNDSALFQKISYYGTPYSLSNELSLFGKKRVNINALVDAGTAAADSAKGISSDLDDIIYVITGKHIYTAVDADSRIFGDEAELSSSEAPMPDFGSRFFSGANTSQKDIYLKKLAANIRDYIDDDSQPTLVNSSGAVVYGNKPLIGWTMPGQLMPQAIGKEAVPYVFEHAWYGYLSAMSINSAAGTTPSTYLGSFSIHQYFEFVNPYTKDFTAPIGTFLKIYNLPSWDCGIYPAVDINDFELDLSGVVFPAGKAVVVTTASSDPAGLLPAGTTVIRRNPIPSTALSWINKPTNKLGIASKVSFQLIARSSSITDYESQYLLGTNLGALDANPIAISLSSGSEFDFRVWNVSPVSNNLANQSRYLYSSSPRGNSDGQASHTGDPRSISEQLVWKAYSNAAGDPSSDQTRWYGSLAGHSDSSSSQAVPGNSTFGKVATSYVTNTSWKDYTPIPGEAADTAIAFVRDGSLKSIGELGHIYDPARVAGASGIDYARGGGRTLKIGQWDDLVSSSRFSSATSAGENGTLTNSWKNAAWRLCDIFGVLDSSSQPLLDATAEGKININGVLRDNGVAFKALLRSTFFNGNSLSDPNITTKEFTSSEMDALVASIKDYIVTNGPFLERGELSQCSYFQGSSSSNKLAGRSFNQINDRGREELFRRTVELITTKSSCYTIYVIADTLIQGPDGSIKGFTRQSYQRTITLTPIIGSALNSKATGFAAETINESWK